MNKDDRIRKAHAMGRAFGYSASHSDWFDLPEMSQDEEQAFADGYRETVGHNKIEAVAFASLLAAAIVLLGVFAWWLKGY